MGHLGVPQKFERLTIASDTKAITIPQTDQTWILRGKGTQARYELFDIWDDSKRKKNRSKRKKGNDCYDSDEEHEPENRPTGFFGATHPGLIVLEKWCCGLLVVSVLYYVYMYSWF